MQFKSTGNDHGPPAKLQKARDVLTLDGITYLFFLIPSAGTVSFPNASRISWMVWI